MKDLTNKELADTVVRIRDLCIHCGDVARAKQLDPLLEAARRLRELPDPTPEPLTLRGLVEKHGCLSRNLTYMNDNGQWNHGPWAWDFEGDNTSGSTIPDSAALTVVRGIVKGLCDERNQEWMESHAYGWKPCGVTKWRSTIPRAEKNPITQIHNTELQAIDALLTAMDE